MSQHLKASLGVDSRIAGPGRGRTGRGPASFRFAKTLFGRSARENGPRSRRAVVGVEAVEPRVSLSGLAVRPMVEDPNIRSASFVRQFNPQPDPPTVATQIIAI